MQRFLDALAKGMFIVAKCKSCYSIVWPPNNVCKECLSNDIEWGAVEEKVKGKVIAVSDSYLARARFVLVELDNGIRLFGRIEEDDNGCDGIKKGSTVKMIRCGIDNVSNEPYFIFKYHYL